MSRCSDEVVDMNEEETTIKYLETQITQAEEEGLHIWEIADELYDQGYSVHEVDKTLTNVRRRKEVDPDNQAYFHICKKCGEKFDTRIVKKRIKDGKYYSYEEAKCPGGHWTTIDVD